MKCLSSNESLKLEGALPTPLQSCGMYTVDRVKLQVNVKDSTISDGGAENAELDIAEPDNAAPYRKRGQRET